MPIQFHDDETIEALGLAAYLHLEFDDAAGAAYGALLFLNARGEPLEFVYNRLELMSPSLWRPADRLRAAARRVCTSLFRAATLSPLFLLCRATAIGPNIFGPDAHFELRIPVGRVGGARDAYRTGSSELLADVESFDANGEVQPMRVLWTPIAPEGGLFALLVERGLLLEPFERAALGLREVYDELG